MQQAIQLRFILRAARRGLLLLLIPGVHKILALARKRVEIGVRRTAAAPPRVVQKRSTAMTVPTRMHWPSTATASAAGANWAWTDLLGSR